jgi:hypothetical protein
MFKFFLKKAQDRKTAIFYVFVSFLVLWTCMLPGYVLTLDMVFTPIIETRIWQSNEYFLYALLRLFDFFLPTWLLQKILLLATLVMVGIGGYGLLRLDKQRGLNTIANYSAGLLYTINPFTYTRLMAGQYLVLLGYALLPFLVRYAFEFVAAPNCKNALKVTLVTILISIVSIHTLGMGLLVLVAVGAYGLYRSRAKREQVKKMLGYAAAGLALFCVLSSYWLVPVLTGGSQLDQTVSGFSQGDVEAFETQPGSVGLALNVLALHGFWGDDKNLYLLAADQYAWWLAPIALLWLLVGLGVWYALKTSRGQASVFLGLGVVGFVLAVGTAGTVFAPFNQFLFDHVPFYAGYREPQKFAALLALAYAYFGAYGVAYVAGRLRGRVRSGVLVALCLLPVACAPLMLFGAAGQLKAVDYPADWYATNEYLQKHAADTKTLFLPWHLYMNFGFAERVIANPAPKFFETTVVASKNPELGGATSYATDALTQKLDSSLLPGAAQNPNLAKDLHALGFSHILVAKEYDYRKYEYLHDKTGIVLERDTKNLLLYSVKAPQ